MSRKPTAHIGEDCSVDAGLSAAAALKEFEQFYLSQGALMTDAVDAITRILRSALDEMKEELAIHDISGRVKPFDSCVQKYNKKYRSKHEDDKSSEKINTLLTDLIGIRVVCLYEDDIEKIAERVKQTFEVICETNKIQAINKDVNHFGYKALHYDLHLGAPREQLGEYRKFSLFPAELQIRTIFQDAWSVIDHQLKYKKSIPPSLARRINVCAALCELADQEFMRVRDDIRANPVKVVSTGLAIVEGAGILDLRGFLDVLHDNFPDETILPDQADVLLATIRRLDPAVSKRTLAEMFHIWGERLQDKYNLYKSRRRKPLSPLTRTRLLLSVAHAEKYDTLVTSWEFRDLCAEIKGSA